jgi:ring-1,2-phenylacetyl-CoA epoxidase subunit PaaB
VTDQEKGAVPENVGAPTSGPRDTEWPLWEVFVRARGGLSHRHVGSIHAPDAGLAIRHARDAYTRREEGISLWVVRSKDIVASDPEQAEALFDPAADKVYRHPTFYDIPDVLRHI